MKFHPVFPYVLRPLLLEKWCHMEMISPLTILAHGSIFLPLNFYFYSLNVFIYYFQETCPTFYALITSVQVSIDT